MFFLLFQVVVKTRFPTDVQEGFVLQITVMAMFPCLKTVKQGRII